MRSGLVLSLLVAACGPAKTTSDAGTSKPDAGPLVNGPMPAPYLRIADAQLGTTHTDNLQGLVAENGPPASVPAALGMVSPADELQLTISDGTTTDLFYTLPKPFVARLFPQMQLTMVYSELDQTFGASYGVHISNLSDGSLILLAEDGYVGPALSLTDRLGFDFTLDTTQPTLTQSIPCGSEVHFATVVSQGGVKRDLFPGQTELFVVNGVNLNFTLLDAYEVQNAQCPEPAFSIAYIVQPAN